MLLQGRGGVTPPYEKERHLDMDTIWTYGLKRVALYGRRRQTYEYVG